MPPARKAPARRKPAEKPDPAARLKPWIRIGRDAALVLIAVFILIWQTVAEESPNITLVTAAMGCLGLPTALRLTRVES